MNDDHVIDPHRTYDNAEVARLVFGCGVRWFYRNYPTLQKEGFPKPIRPVGLRRWLGQNLIEWMERQGMAQLPGSTQAKVAEAKVFERERQILKERTEKLGKTGG